MRYLGLAILWFAIWFFLSSIGLVLTAMVLTKIAFLDFVHEFLFYGLSVAAGALAASVVVRRVYLLQEKSPTPEETS